METIETVRKMLQQNDYMCSLDMTDAYFSISLEEYHRKCLLSVELQFL